MDNNNCPIYLKGDRVMDRDMTNIEKILHSKKVKYTELTRISNPYFKDYKGETINIFIDLFDVVKQLYSPQLLDEYKTIRSKTKMNIISEIINIVGHYRHFFFSRYGKYTTIVLYYSTKKDSYYTSIDHSYKKEFYNKRIIGENSEFFTINKILADCISIVKEYLVYIPHAYLIDTKGMDPRLFPYVIKNEMTLEDTKGLIDPDDYTILMSTSDSSLINLLYNDDCLILKQKKNHEVKYIGKQDIFSELGVSNDVGLPTNFTKYLLSIAGDDSYNISNIPGMKMKKAYKYLVSKFTASNTTLEGLSNGIDSTKFKNNLLLIDLGTYPVDDFKKSIIQKQLVDISDFNYIKQETFEIFSGTSIVLLDYLFDGEEVN